MERGQYVNLTVRSRNSCISACSVLGLAELSPDSRFHSFAVQYRYTDQFSPISQNFANLLICNYFLLLQPSLSFAPLTQTEPLT